jgi:hypothetical protein
VDRWSGVPSYQIEAVPLSEPPSYPDFRPDTPHPWLPAGLNSTPISGQEYNGIGQNWPRFYESWDDVVLPRPTVMAAVGNPDIAMPNEAGQTVDLWVMREKRKIVLSRDFNKVRARGRRGHRSTP